MVNVLSLCQIGRIQLDSHHLDHECEAWPRTIGLPTTWPRTKASRFYPILFATRQVRHELKSSKAMAACNGSRHIFLAGRRNPRRPWEF